jgi:predicted AAA+ superfamily ATPase
MKYIKRNVESTIKKMEKMFTSVLITGARQVGKTTTLRKMKKDIQYITLDDPLMLL